MYSLREGRTSNLDRRTRYSHQSMETHFPRERGRASKEKERSKAACSAEGIRITIQFIHSRPSFNYSFCLYPPLFLCTPSTFPTTTTTTMHPLSHIITRPLWKCVSCPFGYQSEHNHKQTNGVWCRRHPSYTPLLIFQCLHEATRHHLCLTTTITQPRSRTTHI